MLFGPRESILSRSAGTWNATNLTSSRIRFQGGVFNYSSWPAFVYNCGAQSGSAASPACAVLGGSGTASLNTDIPGTLAPYGDRQTIFGLYFQDDYRLSPEPDN